MGYRSQVLFWVEKPAVGRLLTALNTNKEAFDLLFNYAEVTKDEEGNIKFWMNDIKWYRNYEDIGYIEEWMEEEHEELYGFHRLGDEYGDHETKGCSELYWAYPSQNLDYERN